jgi:hypothetical protein
MSLKKEKKKKNTWISTPTRKKMRCDLKQAKRHAM